MKKSTAFAVPAVPACSAAVQLSRDCAIRGQSDRNIRKVRNTMLKKIRKKLLAALTEKVQAQQPLTLLEKEFLSENGVDIEKYTKK